jgi:UDP-glucose 4-epimerase
MTIAWVLGSGGLLGSALCRALRRNGTKLFFAAERFRWASASQFAPQLEAAVQAFAAGVGATDRWEIYWAAGVGTMGSSDRDLALETRFLTLLLRLVESESRLAAKPGAVAFASSAGAIHAGSPYKIITENTPPAPTTAYGREKLRQEDLVRSVADADRRRAVLLARFSTLYGPGQSFGKQQGLLAHIARCILRSRPIQIYVPLDTIRDYIAADDAATAMIAALRATGEGPRVLTKIIASEQPTTIAEIISIFRRIARRAPRVITSASNLTGIYSRRMQFRSVVAPKCAGAPGTSLLVGIAQVMATERSAFVRGPAAGG